MHAIEAEYKINDLLKGRTTQSAREILRRALHVLEDKPTKLSIRTIPYTSISKLCTKVCTVYSGLTDDDLKCQILTVAGRELNFDQLRVLMNLLDMINLNNLQEKHISIQIFDTAVVLEGF